MDKATLLTGITKLAAAGQQAGFTVDQMIGLLNAGLDVAGLLDLIAWRLEQQEPSTPVISLSGWAA